MQNIAVQELRSLFDRAKVVLEFLRKEVLFFLGTNNFRVLMSACANNSRAASKDWDRDISRQELPAARGRLAR